MKKKFALTLTLLVLALSAAACSSVGPRKYIIFGDPQPEKVEMFEDYWKDYPFKPDDPNLPLRRGKGGVIRFFKKNSYTRAIMVDGDLTVNVYYSQKDGVTLTQPDAQMVITSEELNKEHRKFDKENGYSYHVYLDLGEYDQPEEEITILSIFKDAKTGQATLSKEIRTTVMGTSPPIKKEEKTPESEAEKIARQTLGLSEDDDVSPISVLQSRYSARKRQQEEIDIKSKTRVKDSIDLSSSQFEDVDKRSNVQNVSYMEEIEKRRAAKIADILERNKEKQERYRENLEEQAEEYRKEQSARDGVASPIRNARGGGMAARNFNLSDSFVEIQQTQNQNYSQLSNQFGELAEKEYAKGPKNSMRTEPYPTLGYPDAATKAEKSDASPGDSLPDSAKAPDGFEKPRATNSAPLYRTSEPSELDALDDLEVDSQAPPTEVYVKKYGTY